MTPDAVRPRDNSIELTADLDLLAGLWQEAPFARLPPDAPPDLMAYVQNVENPARVYAIHQASRRHGFQLLVERYILQLRSGCENVNCATPTCFTCRRRLAGRAPIRRYNTTSARTLAIYLASQDDPEKGLCPFLRKSREPAAAFGNLIFSTRSSSSSHPDHNRASAATLPSARKERISRPRALSLSSQDVPACPTDDPSDPISPIRHASKPAAACTPHLSDRDCDLVSQIRVIEAPMSKDHRSFAANLFGTVTFKMLEWLTPRSVAAMATKISNLDSAGDFDLPQGPASLARTTAGSDIQSTAPEESDTTASTTVAVQPHATDMNETSFIPKPPKPSNGSLSKSRKNSASKHRRRSTDSNNTTKSGDKVKSTKASQVNSTLHEKSVRPRHNKSLSGRGIPEVSLKPGFFENVTKPSAQSLSPASPSTLAHAEPFGESRSKDDANCGHLRINNSQRTKNLDIALPDISSHSLENILPQALSQLDVNLVDFICDIYEEDGTAQSVIASASDATHPYPRPVNQRKPLRRQSMSRTTRSRKQWQRFNDQTLFNVLMDPQVIVQSFTHDRKLYDSQTLWYCFHRLSRVACNLVFHSLWLAAGRLFVPPQDSRSHNSIKDNDSRLQKHKGSLSDVDAGYLMSICMHALVAAAPAVQDSRTLYEMSRVRSNGLTLAGRSAMARQSSSRCLDYDDAFSNDLAIRLARRLFCAITARRHFSDKMDNAGPLNETENNKVDILQPLVDQLDFLSTGSAAILEFPQSERLLHETRVPTVLLDWARTILLNEWDGRADFTMDGPFGGALSFIETLHANRNLLLLGDIQFRVDYLSERLDSIEMPVDWLAFNSTRWRRHILDYPYIFSPDTLVSFFRSINFARMSRMFEESSSLKTRMSAIVDPGSLITNPHHKMVLQDLLRTASSKYLVLEIGRSNVARDAFDQLWRREKRELLHPLKVHLGENSGEEGFDSGGVQQEFFRLAIAECLDPQYGAFTVDERTRMAWFTPGSLTEDWKYELVGLLMSLALYNGLTLPITFPRALYRKLLGKPVEELHHIADGWPDLASGLTTLLEWDEKDGLVEDIFARTYEFSVESLGTVVTRDMRMDEQADWPKAASSSCDIAPPHMDNPDDAPLVTNENRDDYIIDYIRHLTDVSIRRQYLAFEQGFNSCLDRKSLSLLSPSTLQSLVEGVQEIDISELKRYARYVGWDASHRTIKDFWSIVKRYDERMKQRLLEFVTSSDRVPVGGMKNLQFVIQKNGEEDGAGGHLPTAYTCYGTLLLPEYKDKEVLRERLGMALENAQGFGFA
ncbi:related to ubiquitin-protein ligase [Fusarium fujikuroi IMI 58289]|uniref:HECT-type E3 ubiquitin transferase n=1 Tax=Gibberella fujikuroi (strain CBS 195.34 / IMI 58289 / NRRL A-6831) TaxID=1279085 RepID=S0DNM4_GIBF5|nr:related to ubiquitin-protein ligase [Fusarium fujikuroi IMI 58289]KLP10993.1 ubiquitin-protein ligase [Fusarium fujikuroi]CCT64184.1 related to ubiquitin-protein ligase [Fusarium fujikuroi IMI 58289]SCO27004.1 related to ubiquitin-protein ligase [Fusarium fujikuroi]